MRDGRLIDIGTLAMRLRYVAGTLAVLTLVGVVVDGLRNGLTFALLGRWAALLGALTVVAAAVLVAIQAVRGAGDAARHGERLTGRDVGLIPPRRDAESSPPKHGGASSEVR